MSTFFPEGKKVTVAGEEFTIMPFVLRTRTKILRILTEVCLELSKKNIQESAPLTPAELITTAGDRLIEIYEIVLDKPKEWLEEKITLADEVEIITAIIEVNNIPFLLSQVKNLVGSIKTPKMS